MPHRDAVDGPDGREKQMAFVQREQSHSHERLGGGFGEGFGVWVSETAEAGDWLEKGIGKTNQCKGRKVKTANQHRGKSDGWKILHHPLSMTLSVLW
jgi:hypothetical protein